MHRGFVESIWPTYVDRELPLTKAQRKAIHRDAWRMWMRNRWNLLLYLILPCAYSILLIPARDVTGQIAIALGISGSGYRLVRVAGMVGLPFALFVVGGMIFQRYRFAPLVYEATRRSGYDVCRKCGYWLRDLSEDCARCPECGASCKPSPQASHRKPARSTEERGRAADATDTRGPALREPGGAERPAAPRSRPFS